MVAAGGGVAPDGVAGRGVTGGGGGGGGGAGRTVEAGTSACHEMNSEGADEGAAGASPSRAERRHKGPSAPTAMSSSDSDASRALAGRAAGSFSSSERTHASRAGSVPAGSGGTGSLMCCIIIASGLPSTRNGTRPASSSKATTPVWYRSVHGPTSDAIACSGAM